MLDEQKDEVGAKRSSGNFVNERMKEERKERRSKERMKEMMK